MDGCVSVAFFPLALVLSTNPRFLHVTECVWTFAPRCFDERGGHREPKPQGRRAPEDLAD